MKIRLRGDLSSLPQELEDRIKEYMPFNDLVSFSLTTKMRSAKLQLTDSIDHLLHTSQITIMTPFIMDGITNYEDCPDILEQVENFESWIIKAGSFAKANIDALRAMNLDDESSNEYDCVFTLITVINHFLDCCDEVWEYQQWGFPDAQTFRLFESQLRSIQETIDGEHEKMRLLFEWLCDHELLKANESNTSPL